jgi:hypothetical protein
MRSIDSLKAQMPDARVAVITHRDLFTRKGRIIGAM